MINKIIEKKGKLKLEKDGEVLNWDGCESEIWQVILKKLKELGI